MWIEPWPIIEMKETNDWHAFRDRLSFFRIARTNKIVLAIAKQIVLSTETNILRTRYQRIDRSHYPWISMNFIHRSNTSKEIKEKKVLLISQMYLSQLQNSEHLATLDCILTSRNLIELRHLYSYHYGIRSLLKSVAARTIRELFPSE